jgi:GMP synthase (glutamine-hydrolysing)
MKQVSVWIIDLGSQYTQLIVRRMRELGYSSELLTFKQATKAWQEKKRPKAMILSGGPRSIFEDKNDYSWCFSDSKMPVLGVCYGMQIMAHALGGEVERGSLGEYGKTQVILEEGVEFFPLRTFVAWMSHFDTITKLPDSFLSILESQSGLRAGMIHHENAWLGLQFHPEVEHTEGGREILKYFCEHLAKLKVDWSSSDMLQNAKDMVQSTNAGHTLAALSGGVDSLVAAVLAHQVLGDKLHCFFVDHGLTRTQDLAHIQLIQKQTSLKIDIVNAEEKFLKELKGIEDPELKRKAIGRLFIEVFEVEVARLEAKYNVKFTHLLQGTLYPDVIESVSPHGEEGPSVTIKSHHNVGGLPEKMKLSLMEPFRFLFKDEVRAVGKSLGLPPEWLNRHPFPGPGLGVRIMGEVTKERLTRLRQADHILYQELRGQKLYDDCWQSACIYLPLKTVGVKGDERVYEDVIAIRLVQSLDGMTATIVELPWSFFHQVSARICNEVPGITRVVYDLTTKPPATIEWE